MTNRLNLSLLLICLLLLVGCGNQQQQQAQSMLDHAKELIANEQYTQAKTEIDSLRKEFPKQLAIIKQGVILLRDIELAEQSRTMAYCDSMIQQRLKQAESLTLQFDLESNKEYQTKPYYLHKRLLWDQTERTQLVAKVDQQGALVVESHYCGTTPLRHTTVVVDEIQTQPIAPNGSTNYSYNAGGKHYEIVQYSPAQQNGIIEYLAAHQDQKIHIGLKSDKKTATISLSKAEIIALSQALQLSSALKDIARLQKEYALAQAKVNYLQQKNADTKQRELMDHNNQ